ncbi:MAG TPA: ABC-type transport auxiliary lipoprotein family protein [Steroidobacteraceae bacterium]|nr:ABC-type transport auxiliary lipoprotein family protein [Steroidobacteraceae bacterium]
MRRLRGLLIPLLLALPGCSGLLHSTAPPVQLYVLQPPQVPPDSGPRSGAPSLRIGRPLAAAGLNTDRIALLRPGNRLDYYAGSRWSAPLADLVSDLQVTVFRVDAAWSAVADARSTFNADYLLQTSIDRFTAEYATEAGPPLIHVELHGLLIRRSDGALMGSFAVSEQGVAKQNRMASVIATFSAVADQAISAVQTQADQLLKSAKFPAPP